MALLTSDFDYDLPPELIAQHPLPERSASRMLVLHRATGALEHRRVSDLGRYLQAGDLLVLNNTRVFPARLRGSRVDTGGKVELLLLAPPGQGPEDDGRKVTSCVVPALMKAGFTLRPGLRVRLAEGQIRGEILAVGDQGRVDVRLEAEGDPAAAVAAHGEVPLPPYIRRGEDGACAARDRERYQTVYARHPGAVAAPTAGLHFTPALLGALRDGGVATAEVTLHVGEGTFRPVTVEQVAEHTMHAEWYCVEARAAAAIGRTRSAGGRIVAVGTTTVRTLETTGGGAGEGWSDLFIYPPRPFRCVDAMLTNFHLPRSTLLMLVSAFAGRERVLGAYAEAVRRRYRFYSYGDSMLIL